MIGAYDALNDSKYEARTIYDVVDTDCDSKVKINKSPISSPAIN